MHVLATRSNRSLPFLPANTVLMLTAPSGVPSHSVTSGNSSPICGAMDTLGHITVPHCSASYLRHCDALACGVKRESDDTVVTTHTLKSSTSCGAPAVPFRGFGNVCFLLHTQSLFNGNLTLAAPCPPACQPCCAPLSSWQPGARHDHAVPAHTLLPHTASQSCPAMLAVCIMWRARRTLFALCTIIPTGLH